MCTRARQPIQTAAHELLLGLVLSKSVTLRVICCLFSFNPNCVLGEWVSVAQVARTTGVGLLENTRQLSEQQWQADPLVAAIPQRLSSQASTHRSN